MTIAWVFFFCITNSCAQSQPYRTYDLCHAEQERVVRETSTNSTASLRHGCTQVLIK